MPLPDLSSLHSALALPPVQQAKHWWKRQHPHLQDRLAMLAPLAAVLIFFVAIVTAFGYLRTEEIDREQEAVQRDVEYTQQRLRLRLLERQEQLTRVAREISNRELDLEEFRSRADTLINQYAEIQGLAWFDDRRRLRVGAGSATQAVSTTHITADQTLRQNNEQAFALARQSAQPIYLQGLRSGETAPLMQIYFPLMERNHFSGVLLAELSVDGLYRYGVPDEVTSRYAISLLDAKGGLLAGTAIPARKLLLPWLPGSSRNNAYAMPVSPVGSGLQVRGQAYRASLGVIGSGFFWLVGALSVMTAWMLIANFRHTRRRLQAQQALVAETNFRRAMENSMPTGMRAMDLQGRITYVNAAFCQMTGWSEAELVGRSAPFPYWPEADREVLASMLEEELSGKHAPGGFQVRVKRRDKTTFHARLYVAPLIDAMGTQTGWVTSMTDITEPNRVREQLTASHQRFTTVLEALDASISVAPLGSDELLFANKLYRQWFGTLTNGHLQLVAEAGVPSSPTSSDKDDSVDALAGLPTEAIADTETESGEIYDQTLGKWLEVRTRYLSWVDGRLAQMVIATDITTRRLAEQQAATQAERAQNSSRLITMGEMASSVAHELNQPLTAINNYCNGMISRIRASQISEDDLLGALDKTARQAQRAGQIIQRIRSFVKRSEPNRSPSDVSVLVGEAMELAEIELRRRNVRLQHFIAANLPIVQVDPILIEQVLFNLLRNAAEAIDAAQRPTAQRLVKLRVHGTEVDGQSAVVFSVRDSGKGLAPEVMARLYEAFFSTKADGMGIGLSLCRSIVESHRGRMTAENTYNGLEVAGCRFSFWIPVVNPSMDTQEMPLPTR